MTSSNVVTFLNIFSYICLLHSDNGLLTFLNFAWTSQKGFPQNLLPNSASLHPWIVCVWSKSSKIKKVLWQLPLLCYRSAVGAMIRPFPNEMMNLWGREEVRKYIVNQYPIQSFEDTLIFNSSIPLSICAPCKL